MCKLHLLLHRMESSVTHASFAKKGGRNGKNEIESKSSCLIKKKRKKRGQKQLQVQIIGEQIFLKTYFNRCTVYLRTEHIKILKRHSHSVGLFNFFITLPIKKTLG